MKVDATTIENLDSFLKEHQEADVVELLVRKLDVTVEEALAIYFNSNVASMIESGTLGTQYLSPEYLVEEIVQM